MKLACSSASFDVALAAGALTQLEWLDLCARTLRLDGVIFDARHFPRTDDEYLAQLKKLAVDLGLTVAGLACDGLTTAEENGGEGSAARWLTIAATLGAPLAVAAAPRANDDDPGAWHALVASARVAASAAKRSNVALGIRNVPGTLCASGADLKQLSKEVDSSWLRYALDVAALEPAEVASPLLQKTIVAIAAAPPDGLTVDEGLLGTLAEFRGFLAVDRRSGDAEPEAFARLLDAMRLAAARLAPAPRRG